ncbi:hypothetical protein [Streptomyces sp. RKAG337]|uniref:hypothetical protein n=1 Tax=Streptomyces sp. RKAG337 TaxID=2893404 RepID=UPI0020334B6A|nr:hypothetical protein [Streptomyces sp. RKAG337]MCM2430948.1 hypothetical protein [Streptomyces sp. RKAG337]
MSYITALASAVAPGYPVSFKVYGDHPVQDHIAEGTVTATKRTAFMTTEVSLDNGRTYPLPVTRRVRVHAAFLKSGYANEVANSGPAIDWLADAAQIWTESLTDQLKAQLKSNTEAFFASPWPGREKLIASLRAAQHRTP